jgi:hypothetical protein
MIAPTPTARRLAIDPRLVALGLLADPEAVQHRPRTAEDLGIER